MTKSVDIILLVPCHLKHQSKVSYSLLARLAIFVLFCSPLVCTTLLAQEPSCTVEVPAIVTLPNAALVERLGAEDFVAHGKGGPTKIVSVSTDRGPRHILFVIETGKQVPPAARKIQAEILSDVLKNARTEDAFAILTGRGPRKIVQFGASKETLLGTIEEIGIGLPGKNQDTGVLDSILEGVDWFQPHKVGDAIFVLTMGVEASHRASFAKVRDGLVKAHIRLFGFQLGPVIGGYYQAGVGMGASGQMIPTAWIDPNHENLFALSRYTGGFVAVENAQGGPWKEYHLTDERLGAVLDAAWQEYKAILESYKIQIQGYPKDLEINLNDSIRKQLPHAQVMYPQNLRNCSEVSSLPGQ